MSDQTEKFNQYQENQRQAQQQKPAPAPSQQPAPVVGAGSGSRPTPPSVPPQQASMPIAPQKATPPAPAPASKLRKPISTDTPTAATQAPALPTNTQTPTHAAAPTQAAAAPIAQPSIEAPAKGTTVTLSSAPKGIPSPVAVGPNAPTPTPTAVSVPAPAPAQASTAQPQTNSGDAFKSQPLTSGAQQSGPSMMPGLPAVSAPTQPQTEPSDDFLRKIMGSYNPASKVDRAQAAKVRELYAQGKTTAKDIYASPEYQINREALGARSGANQSAYSGLNKRSEEDYMLYLRGELLKLSKETNSPYSEEYINKVTSSPEEFNKAAQEEARMVWEGMKDTLKKSGADDDFILGIEKEAGARAMFGMAFNPKMWGRFGPNPRAVWEVGKGSFAGAGPTNKLFERAAKGERELGGTFRDTSGIPNPSVEQSLLLDPVTRPKKMPGARTHQVSERLESVLGPNISREQKDYLDKIRAEAAGEFREAANRLGANKIEDYVSNLDLAARRGGSQGANAYRRLEEIGKGDWQGVGKDLKLDPNVVQGIHDPVHAQRHGINIPDPRHTEKMKGWAQEYVKNPQTAPPLSGVMSAERAAARPMNEDWFRFTPRQAMEPALGGAALLGTAGLLSPIPYGAALGTTLGGLGGAAIGTLGPGGAALAGAGALGGAGYFGAKKMFGGGGSSDTDKYGLPADRNRALPILNNKFAGGVGGAILGALLARELGLGEGMGGLLFPILGGIAGHHYLPELMNKWKDPYGMGANRVHPLTSYVNNPQREASSPDYMPSRQSLIQVPPSSTPIFKPR